MGVAVVRMMLSIAENRRAVAILGWLRFPDGIAGRFAFGAAWALVGAVAATGSTQAAVVVFGRLLGSEGLGALAMIQNTVVLGGVISGSGVAIAATKHLAAARGRGEAEQRAVASAATTIAWIAGGAVCLLFLAVSEWIAGPLFGRQGYLSALRVSSILILLNAVLAVKQGVLAGYEDYRGIAHSNTVRGVFLVLFSVALAPTRGLQGAIEALAISTAAGVAVCSARIRKGQRSLTGEHPTFSTLKSTTWGLWKSAIPVLLSGVAIAAGNLLASALLAKTKNGLVEMGLYYAADRWRLLCGFLATYGGVAALPILSNTLSTGDSEGFRRMTRMSLLIAVFATLPLSIAAAVFSKPLMHTYGEGYADAWPVMVTLTLSALPMAVNSALGQVLVSRGKFWERAILDLALAATLVGAALVLVGRYGAMGLATANAVGYAVVSIVLFMRCLDHAK